jgi:AraC-like DNA-binding protein
MVYTTLSPHSSLAPYIDAYWTVKSSGQDKETSRILPDGCMDIIINLGEDEGFMRHGEACLVGTMTRPFDSEVHPGADYVGIRFKPGAFSAFYTYSSLHEITDQAIACEKGMAPDLSLLRSGTRGLDSFFVERLSRPGHALFPILEEIHRCHGLVRVEELARRHFITVRQLERSFRYYIGVSPKEVIRQERFRYTMGRVRGRKMGEGLSGIATACGYYDHGHMAHEIKKYAGETPGLL